MVACINLFCFLSCSLSTSVIHFKNLRCQNFNNILLQGKQVGGIVMHGFCRLHHQIFTSKSSKLMVLDPFSSYMVSSFNCAIFRIFLVTNRPQHYCLSVIFTVMLHCINKREWKYWLASIK